ncbi:MAG: hypothetical protein R3325_16695, partial [Thermoanaerobaculia bacterium]|nr:hypothetical protein [Thermoanaerobaculia bacterium]
PFQEFVRDMARTGGFLVRVGEEIPLLSTWRVRLAAPGGGFELEAEAVRRFDAVSGEVGVGFALTGWGPERAEALERAVAGDGAGQPVPDESAAGEPEAPEGEMMGSSPAHRIRELDPNRRGILATRAGRAERQILLRDTSPQVLQSLLANPRLEAKEVLALVQSTRVTAGILQRVAGDARWGKNQEIVTAVTRNPKTPLPMAVRLVEKLRTADLRRMAKMAGGLRESLRRAALREYLKRTEGR